MRGLYTLVMVLACTACAQGTEDTGDDSPGNPDATGGDDDPIDAPLPIDAPPPIDAPLPIDAPTPIDASTPIDAGGTGVVCPDTIDYYFKAVAELSEPMPAFCTLPTDCTSAECCYGALVCVAYP